MKNIAHPVILLLIHICSIAQSGTISDKLTARVMSKKEMLEDFNYLREILEETHPALYRYTLKNEMLNKMDSISGLFNRDMPFYDYYQILAAFIADIRCAHTYVIPQKDINTYFNKKIRMLPFEIIPVSNRLYITLNGNSDTLIKPGMKFYPLMAGRRVRYFNNYIVIYGPMDLSSLPKQHRSPVPGLVYFIT